jgi:cysteine desulfurase
MTRAYLDWNATAPLRPEARAAMLSAMDLLGNPSSVHAEGRAARAVLETARRQVAAAAGCDADGVVFTSGATEAAALALKDRGFAGDGREHPAVRAWVGEGDAANGRRALQLANNETGLINALPEGLGFTDAVQGFGKIPFAFAWSGVSRAAISAHKIGGPKGAGALLLAPGVAAEAQIRGGGQEQGRRAGTENLIALAGFGAAAAAAARDLDRGEWERVVGLRDRLEDELASIAPDAVIIGRGDQRLPNTTCIAVPGWKGETQVMQMDLAGFAISAGSACSSGKVRPSGILQAMGFDDLTAGSAIRISIGPATRWEELSAFARAWADHYRRFRAKAA